MCVRVALQLGLFVILSQGRQSLQTVQHMIVTKQDSRPSEPLTGSQQEVQDACRNDLVGKRLCAVSRTTKHVLIIIKARILRALAAGGFIEEIGDNVYAPNSMTQALTEPANAAMFIHKYVNHPPVSRLHPLNTTSKTDI